EGVAVGEQRVARADECDQVEHLHRRRRDVEEGDRPADRRDEGEKHYGQREVTTRAVAAAQPDGRGRDAEGEERDGVDVLHEGDEVAHLVQATPRAAMVDSSPTSASTTSGSHCLPAPSVSVEIASSTVRALRYGRSVTSASYASQTATIRARRGMARPARPSG